MTAAATIAAVLRAAADEIERLSAAEADERRGWLSQAESPLGRKHNAAVRARLTRGEHGAAIVGRRHMLSAAALAEELARVSTSKRTAPKAVSVAPISTQNRLELAVRRAGK